MSTDDTELEDLLSEDFSRPGSETSASAAPASSGAPEPVQIYEEDALNVLIADPEDEWGRRIENLLVRWFSEFISVSRVRTVEALEDRLRLLNVDVLVTEISWPQKDPTLFLEELMEQPGIAEIPIIVFSDIKDEMFETFAYRMGVLDFFTKVKPDLFRVEFRLRNIFRMQFHNKILYRQIDESLHRYQKTRGLSEEEIRDLRDLVQVMKEELEREYQNKNRLEEEKKRIQNVFGLYVDPSIINGVMNGDISLELKGVEQDICVLFADIRGYTAMAETLNPQSVVSFLNEYFTSMTEVLLGYDALIDKYIGDAIMALFGAPLPRAEYLENAIQAAMEMQSVFELWRTNWEKNYGISPHIGIGIASGKATLGNFGSFQKLSYTAIGDTVNQAARLASIAAPDEVLVNDNLYSGLSDVIRQKYSYGTMPPITLKGKSVPVNVWTVREK